MVEAKKAEEKQHNSDSETCGEVLAPPQVSRGDCPSEPPQEVSKYKAAISNYLRSLWPNNPAQTAISIFMAVIAFFTWRVYEKQLAGYHTGERAWLKFTLGDHAKASNEAVIVAPAQPVSVRFSITNIGETAAKGIYVDACVEILDSTLPAQAEWMSRCYRRPHHRAETGMLFPGDKISDSQMQRIDQRLIPLPATPNQSQQFADGKAYVVVFGRVHYIDVFQQERWTQFCFPVMHGDLNDAARQCVNFADEGEGDYDRNYAKAQ